MFHLSSSLHSQISVRPELSQIQNIFMKYVLTTIANKAFLTNIIFQPFCVLSREFLVICRICNDFMMASPEWNNMKKYKTMKLSHLNHSQLQLKTMSTVLKILCFLFFLSTFSQSRSLTFPMLPERFVIYN